MPFGTDNVYTSTQAHANSAAAAADQSLVAAPGANKYIVIDYFIVSAAGTGNFWFETGTSTQIGPRLELVAGQAHISGETRIKCAANEALTWTSVGAGISTHSVFVLYHVEGA